MRTETLSAERAETAALLLRVPQDALAARPHRTAPHRGGRRSAPFTTVRRRSPPPAAIGAGRAAVRRGAGPSARQPRLDCAA
jgi:hypothetical protein